MAKSRHIWLLCYEKGVRHTHLLMSFLIKIYISIVILKLNGLVGGTLSGYATHTPYLREGCASHTSVDFRNMSFLIKMYICIVQTRHVQYTHLIWGLRGRRSASNLGRVRSQIRM